uniref:Serum response factor-binding protein 1 n=1 Tax=Trichuris muris TaxID=70415 RepID=A0A5S6R286_TRIMR
MPTDGKSKALELNNQIVRMRALIGQARFRLMRKCIRRIKQMKKRSLPEEKMKRLERKMERLGEELEALKHLKYDDASKFALVNTKSLTELNVQKETPARDRALYKLVTLPIVVDCVNDYRSKHPNWHQEVPFHLQRLGLQYKLKRAKKAELAKIRKANRSSAAVETEENNSPKKIDRQGRFGTALVSKLKIEKADSQTVDLGGASFANNDLSSSQNATLSVVTDASDAGNSDQSEVDDFFIMERSEVPPNSQPKVGKKKKKKVIV